MKHSVAGRRCIYLSLFSVDNPEAVNVMSISNIRAHEAEASIHPREGLSTHCRGKEVNCALHRLWEGRGQATPTLPLKPLESLSNSCWNKSLPFFLLISLLLPSASTQVPPCAQSPAYVSSSPPEFPCHSVFPLALIPSVSVTPDRTQFNSYL